MEKEEKADEEQLACSFSDPQWDPAYLNKDTILDYFAKSDFFNPNSCNGLLRMQGIYSADNLLNMTGIQYAVTTADKENDLFVIEKFIRRSKEETELKGIYYVLGNTIFQAPPLMAILQTRISNALYYMHEALRLYQANVETDRQSKYELLEKDSTEESEKTEQDEETDTTNEFVSDPPPLYYNTYAQFMKKYEPPRINPAVVRKRKIDQTSEQQAKRAKLV